jgi:hypothetical protein
MTTGGMLQTPPTTEPGPPQRSANALAWAWLSLLLLPLSFAAGFAAAHLPYAWTGRDEGASAPLWFNLVVAVIGVGITWLPVGASLVFGRRALRAGSRAAWAPITIALLLTAGALVLVVTSTLNG